MRFPRAKEHDPLVADLKRALAPDRVRSAPLERTIMSRDASIFDGGRDGPVCFPLSTEEVQRCVQTA
ncbi:MAG: hypothetical protein OXF04_09420, partial [bacterium]|nr:hypothetical protein [bacterium]